MNSYIVRPILRTEPRVRPFLEAVLRSAAETGVTLKEMKDAFAILTDAAESRAREGKVSELGIRVPEDKK